MDQMELMDLMELIDMMELMEARPRVYVEHDVA